MKHRFFQVQYTEISGCIKIIYPQQLITPFFKSSRVELFPVECYSARISFDSFAGACEKSTPVVICADESLLIILLIPRLIIHFLCTEFYTNPVWIIISRFAININDFRLYLIVYKATGWNLLSTSGRKNVKIKEVSVHTQGKNCRAFGYGKTVYRKIGIYMAFGGGKNGEKEDFLHSAGGCAADDFGRDGIGGKCFLYR